MKTLYERLAWICMDRNPSLGKARPKDIEELLKLSSGRPTQIKAKGEAARLGAEKLAILTEMGYSADWIQLGKGEPRASDAPPVGPGMSDQEKIKHIQAALQSMLVAAGLPPSSVTIAVNVAEGEKDHIAQADGVTGNDEGMDQNAARQPSVFGRDLDPLSGADGKKKSPTGKGGEGQ